MWVFIVFEAGRDPQFLGHLVNPGCPSTQGLVAYPRASGHSGVAPGRISTCLSQSTTTASQHGLQQTQDSSLFWMLTHFSRKWPGSGWLQSRGALKLTYITSSNCYTAAMLRAWAATIPTDPQNQHTDRACLREGTILRRARTDAKC